MEQSMRFTSQPRIMTVLAAIMIILAVVAVLAFRTMTRMIHDREWVAHSQEVLAELHETRALIDDAEDEQRGFLITGDESFLAPFEDGMRGFISKLDPLRRLMADHPAQRPRIDRLALAAQTNFAAMRAIIDTRRLLGPREARAQLASEVRKNPVSEPRSILLKMVADERALLQQRIDQARSSDLWAITLLAMLLLSFLVCLTVFFWMIVRSLRKRARRPSCARAASSSSWRCGDPTTASGIGTSRRTRSSSHRAGSLSLGTRITRSAITSPSSSRGCTATTASEC
jgi:methyl-accepting chemotaxis protein